MDWMANQIPTWAAYWAFMSGRLIALDKQPGIRLVGVGETCHRIFSKCVLKVTGPEANHACKDYQIWAGLKAGIDGRYMGLNLSGTLTLPRNIVYFNY